MGCYVGLDNGEKKMSVFSDFRREADENCTLLGCYTARSGNFLPEFRDNISTCSKTNHDFAQLSETCLIHASIQDCYLQELKHFKLYAISKEPLHFIVLRFWVSPLVASLPTVFVSSYERSKIGLTQLS